MLVFQAKQDRCEPSASRIGAVDVFFGLDGGPVHEPFLVALNRLYLLYGGVGTVYAIMKAIFFRKLHLPCAF